ncbi:MAG TPA: SRPBCC family protein [Phenylobacterium sp.]|nr:SRPBCC family protein [Phenylobacterium sp.]
MRHHVTKHLPYTPDQLYTLVGDVDRYPEFVPWIVGMRTWNSRIDATGLSWTDAEAKVGFSFLRERFSTRVRRDPAARQIDVDLLSGPFDRLRNRWVFFEEPGGTRVEFDIDFAFKTRLLEALLSRNFEHAVDRLMQCFEGRAKALYG